MKNWSNYRVVYSPSPPSRTEQRNEALEAEPSRSADAQGVDDGVNANAVCAYRDNAFKMAPRGEPTTTTGGGGTATTPTPARTTTTRSKGEGDVDDANTARARHDETCEVAPSRAADTQWQRQRGGAT